MGVTASAAVGACVLAALPLIGLVAHPEGDTVLARSPAATSPAGTTPAATSPAATSPAASSSAATDSAAGASFATAKAEVEGVRGFLARVESTPSQRVTGTWIAVCMIEGDRGRVFDTFAGQTPLDVVIPLTVERPGTCTITATAKGDQGHVTIELRAT